MLAPVSGIINGDAGSDFVVSSDDDAENAQLMSASVVPRERPWRA